MGVLVHQSFRSEKANGVGVSRNVFDPEQGHIYFLTVQAGEASVTNPAPGVTAESMLYDFTDDPDYRSFSTLVDSGGEDGARVLSSEEVEKVGCTLFGIDKAFKPTNDRFAMDIEFKIVGDDRELVVKQARPYSFGSGSGAGGNRCGVENVLDRERIDEYIKDLKTQGLSSFDVLIASLRESTAALTKMLAFARPLNSPGGDVEVVAPRNGMVKTVKVAGGAGVWDESEARLPGDDNSGVLPSSANPPAGASLWREGGDLETGGTTQNITSTTTATNVGSSGTPASPKTSGSRTAGVTNTQQGKTSALLRVVKLQRLRSGDGSELDTAYDTAL
eukprot:gene9209-2630_t